MSPPPHNLVWVLHSDRYGGMEKYVALALRHVDRTRFCPFLLLPSAVRGNRLVCDPLLEDVGDDVAILAPNPSKHRGMLANIDEIRGSRDLFRRVGAQVVHLHSADPLRPIWAAAGARSARVPVLLRTDHLPPPEAAPGVVDRVARRMCDRWLSAVVVPSEGNRIEHIERLGRSPQLVRTVYNGIDIDRHRSIDRTAEAKARLGIDPCAPTVGAIARLDEQKGIHLLLLALAELRRRGHRVRAFVVGSGPLEAALRSQADELQLAECVEFTGHQDDPGPYLQALDIAVLPSFYEGFSLSMMEYMAAGRACVFSDHPSFVEAVGGEDCAVIVPRGDHGALANAIEGLLGDPVRRSHLGLNARSRVERLFSIETHVSNLMQLYDELLTQG